MIDFVIVEITADILPYNPGLKQSHIGHYGVAAKGSSRVIEICDTESSANDVVEAVMRYQKEVGNVGV